MSLGCLEEYERTVGEWTPVSYSAWKSLGDLQKRDYLVWAILACSNITRPEPQEWMERVWKSSEAVEEVVRALKLRMLDGGAWDGGITEGMET